MTASAAQRSAPAAQQDKTIGLVKSLERSFSVALPAHVTKEHFARALLTEFRRTPRLINCTPESIGAAVTTAAQLGLMIGVNGAAWLIPFKDECTLIIGYQGMIDLCYRSDRLESIFADVVCENDEFHFVQGLNQCLDHVPCLTGPRGTPYAVYALANIKGSSRPVYVILGRDEVMKVKAASPATRKSDSPWNGPFETEMWKKTAIRRLTKLLPKSVDLMNALDYEDREAARFADATVVSDDPFAAGRNTLASRNQAAAIPPPEPKTDPVEPDASPVTPPPPAADPEPADEFKKAYAKLSLIYDEPGMADAIDSKLRKITGNDSLILPKIPRDAATAREKLAIIRTADEVNSRS